MHGQVALVDAHAVALQDRARGPAVLVRLPDPAEAGEVHDDSARALRRRERDRLGCKLRRLGVDLFLEHVDPRPHDARERLDLALLGATGSAGFDETRKGRRRVIRRQVVERLPERVQDLRHQRRGRGRRPRLPLSAVVRLFVLVFEPVHELPHVDLLGIGVGVARRRLVRRPRRRDGLRRRHHRPPLPLRRRRHGRRRRRAPPAERPRRPQQLRPCAVDVVVSGLRRRLVHASSSSSSCCCCSVEREARCRDGRHGAVEAERSERGRPQRDDGVPRRQSSRAALRLRRSRRQSTAPVQRVLGPLAAHPRAPCAAAAGKEGKGREVK
uniref:Uncharacterized protein n=1 Tax=Zea mays TaxID=4577 RepID=A0A804PVZ3_MAIZE